MPSQEMFHLPGADPAGDLGTELDQLFELSALGLSDRRNNTLETICHTPPLAPARNH